MTTDIERFNINPHQKKYVLVLAPEPEVIERKQSIQLAINTFQHFNYQQIHLVGPSQANQADNWDNSKASIEKCLKKISKKIKHDDFLTLYLTTIGYQEHAQETFMWFKDGQLTSKALGQLVNTYIPETNRLIISDVCFGYDMMLPLLSNEGDVRISASGPNKTSWQTRFQDEFFPELKSTGNIFKAFRAAYHKGFNQIENRQSAQFLELAKQGLQNLEVPQLQPYS
jgi:hypothetical protein